MSAITGKVVQVKLNTPVSYAPPKTGTYTGYKLVYENDQGEVKTLQKAMQSLKNTPTVREALESLVAGDEVTIIQEKKGDFLDVVQIVKGTIADATPAQTATNGDSTTVSTTTRRETGGKVLGSTYETPEERKLKQRLIVRQSSFAQALEFSKVEGESGTLSEIKEFAEEIESWVYRGLE
jgi:hypothetical protein